ncbi:MAG: 3-deoxy-manno-octulosonate cytidylyltransferase [bacterium]|nr:3-deoxy-manno-octulosonate cytidylyltransferase [bacterium]
MDSKENYTFKVAVPAHLASERLAEKVLVDIKGKAMLLRVLEQCEKAVGRENCCVVTPDEKIADRVREWGFDAFMSPKGLPDGSSAIAAALPQLNVDYVLNVQGDQPLIPPELVSALLENLTKSGADMVTPVFKVTELADLGENGVAKVIRTLDGWALYFSRAPIPHLRDVPYEKWLETATYWGHYGIYGYPAHVLGNLNNLKRSFLEAGEKLEQLRLLHNGLRVFTFETTHRQLAVDTEEDLKKVLTFL